MAPKPPSPDDQNPASADDPELAKKLAELEKKLTDRLDVHEAAIVQVLREVMQILNPPPEPEPPRRRIGFHQS